MQSWKSFVLVNEVKCLIKFENLSSAQLPRSVTEYKLGSASYSEKK